MLLRAEKQSHTSSPAVSPHPPSPQRSAVVPSKTETRREVTPELDTRGKGETEEVKASLQEEEKVEEMLEERQEPEGRLADANVMEFDRGEVLIVLIVG